jgi:hypothetical protein
MQEMLLNNEFTQKYLVDLPSNPMIDDHNQMVIKWKFGKLECKSILDKVLVDHNDKRIIPMDIKTTSKGVSNFIQSFIRYGYFRQCSFYDYAIRYWLEHLSEIEDHQKWTIEPFRFIVVDSNLNDFPLIYRCSGADLRFGRDGGYLPYSNRHLKGWVTLTEDLAFYQNKRDWRYNVKALIAEGELVIDAFSELSYGEGGIID